MSETNPTDWNELLIYLRKAARAIFRCFHGVDGDYEDAAQEACFVVFMTENVRCPKALGQVVLKRLRNHLQVSHALTKRAYLLECDVAVRAGFDAGLMAGDWIANAKQTIPPTYREVVDNIAIMGREHSPEKRSNAIRQRGHKARRMMRAALAQTG